jgi:hypothetical protein
VAETVDTVKHRTVGNDATINSMASFTLFLTLLFTLDEIFMLVEFETARAFPSRIELFTDTTFAITFIKLMNLI